MSKLKIDKSQKRPTKFEFIHPDGYLGPLTDEELMRVDEKSKAIFLQDYKDSSPGLQMIARTTVNLLSKKAIQKNPFRLSNQDLAIYSYDAQESRISEEYRRLANYFREKVPENQKTTADRLQRSKNYQRIKELTRDDRITFPFPRDFYRLDVDRLKKKYHDQGMVQIGEHRMVGDHPNYYNDLVVFDTHQASKYPRSFLTSSISHEVGGHGFEDRHANAETSFSSTIIDNMLRKHTDKERATKWPDFVKYVQETVPGTYLEDTQFFDKYYPNYADALKEIIARVYPQMYQDWRKNPFFSKERETYLKSDNNLNRKTLRRILKNHHALLNKAGLEDVIGTNKIYDNSEAGYKYNEAYIGKQLINPDQDSSEVQDSKNLHNMFVDKINWLRKPWQVKNPLKLNNNQIDELNKLYESINEHKRLEYEAELATHRENDAQHIPPTMKKLLPESLKYTKYNTTKLSDIKNPDFWKKNFV